MSIATADDGALLTLQHRIGWLCQGVRFAALAFATYLLIRETLFWSDVDAIEAGYGRFIHADLSGIGPAQQLAAFAISFAIWLFAAYACHAAWRLFSGYLDGEILSGEAALWLRRLALAGLASEALDIATRPLLSLVLTLHFPAGHGLRVLNVFVLPGDMALLMLFAALVAIAHVQKCAADIAAEYAQFV